MNSAQYNVALGKYRAVMADLEQDSEMKALLSGKEACLGQFGPVFSTIAVNKITSEQFKSFLLFENNRHWSGLNRNGWRACENIKVLRAALALLLDEKKPLITRMNKMADEVPGMGKALITSIMLVAYPQNYGVWNNTSETALKMLEMWPEFERGWSFGRRYQAVNQVLLQLATDLDVDLWTLDALHWRLLKPIVDSSGNNGLPPSPGTDETHRFGLERHLHEFLRDNWGKTSLGKEWELYQEQGDPEAGYEYPTAIGKIDLLAKHRTQPRWLVVELKRGQTSDDTVGQILRYMGWVNHQMAGQKETVEGLIICHDAEDKLRFAVSAIPKVSVHLYDVSFSLRPDPRSLQGNGKK